MEHDLVPPYNLDNLSTLIARVFERAMAQPAQVKEVFPDGCPGGTVSTIISAAKRANPTDDPAYTSWLLYRWVEGRITLSEMVESTDTIAQYVAHVRGVPTEGRSIFGMNSLYQIEALLSSTVNARPNQTIRTFVTPAVA